MNKKLWFDSQRLRALNVGNQYVNVMSPDSTQHSGKLLHASGYADGIWNIPKLMYVNADYIIIFFKPGSISLSVLKLHAEVSDRIPLPERFYLILFKITGRHDG